MRTSVTAEFQNYLITKTSKTLARCWKVVCVNGGPTLGFTTHTRNIVFDGLTYTTISGLSTSSVKSATGLSVDNLTVSAFLGAQDERDIFAGVYDGAYVEVFVINYFNLSMGRLVEKTGFIGEITRSDGMFQAEIRGLTDMLRTRIGRLFTAGCDYRLGDSRCKFVIVPVSASITTVVSIHEFTSSGLASFSNGHFSQGNVTFTSGNNIGITRDVRFHESTRIDTFLSIPFAMQVGDTFDIEVGCDKLKSTCRDKFANVINYGGFDYTPVIDQVFDSPVTIGLGIGMCAADDPANPDPGDTGTGDGGSTAGGGPGGGPGGGDGGDDGGF